MSIQSAWNQALSSVAHARIDRYLGTAAKERVLTEKEVRKRFNKEVGKDLKRIQKEVDKDPQMLKAYEAMVETGKTLNVNKPSTTPVQINENWWEAAAPSPDQKALSSLENRAGELAKSKSRLIDLKNKLKNKQNSQEPNKPTTLDLENMSITYVNKENKPGGKK